MRHTMKKLIAVSILFASLNATAKMGSTENVKYAGDLNFKSFCEAVVKDDLNMLKRQLRNKIGIVSSNHIVVLDNLLGSEGMQCNGLDLVAFSKQRDASKVLSYLSNKQ
jgi:hypothetical protein